MSGGTREKGFVFRVLTVGPAAANCYVLGDQGSGDALVVDPGGEPERIMAVLAREHLAARLIVNTHGHVDHIGANAALKQATGARILIHEDDAGFLVEPEKNLSLFLSGERLSGPAADSTVSDGHEEELGRGSVRFRTLHTPGHTPGSMCLLFDGYVLTGDTLFAGGVGRTDLPGGDPQKLAASLRQKLFPLAEATLVYPGHGPDTTLKRELDVNPFLRDTGLA